MGMSVKGITATKNRLERTTRRTSKRGREAFRDGAQKILELSRSNAPRKDGNLEKAIRKTEELGSIFTNRISILIGIDESKLGPGYQKHGFDYGDHLHETEWEPGKGSKEKIAAGHDVGPGFMKRALEELEDEIADRIQKIADEEAR